MVVIWILTIAGILFLAALYLIYRLAFYYRDPQAAPQDYIADDQIEAVRPILDREISNFQAAAYESVSIRSHDGLILTGRYYHMADNAPVYIQMHGYKGNGVRDFCGTWPIARELGHNVLLIDQRCCGGSGGHTITFGIREQLDCCSWVQYICRRFGAVPILLMGVSMGAASVLMASGQDLPGTVKGIVADCPYDTPAGILKKVLAVELGLPVKPLYFLTRLAGILFGRFDLESCSPLQAVKKAKTPILLIHGEEDRFVPCEMSRNLQRCAPESITLYTIPGSGHALNQITDPVLYRSILIPFIQKHLKV